MLQWLRQRKMSGGVVFGPPAWSPLRLETTFPAALENPAANGSPSSVRELPHERREAATFLEDLGIGPTSAIIPGLADQLRALGDARVRAVILNLIPTQPEFALPEALARLAFDDLLAGFNAIDWLAKPRRLIVALDRHDLQLRNRWASLRHTCTSGRRLELATLLNRYPQGHPTMLVRSLFGKRLHPDWMPSRLHYLLLDPVSCWALGRWIRTGQAMAERPIQLFVQSPAESRPDKSSGEPRLVMGRIATPHYHATAIKPAETIAELCLRYGVETANQDVIVNGMLSGCEVSPLDAIDSATESITILPDLAPENSSPCIACGWCVDMCPTGLTPVRLADLAGQIPTGLEIAQGAPGIDIPRLLKSLDVRESIHCISCGLCSYVCPTRLPLTQETSRLRLRVLAASGRILSTVPGEFPRLATPPAASEGDVP